MKNMEPIFHKDFKKQYKNLNKNIQNKFDEILTLFMNDALNSTLNNHFLHGEYKGFKSINITYDIRAIYKIIDNNIAHFIFIGTHSKLYK